MAANETLTFDGLALNDATTFTLEALDVPPPNKRPEWISAADADGSALVRDPLFENREITARVRIEPQSTMDLVLAKIGLLVDKIEEAEHQPDGLALAWTPADATKSVTFYVLSGEITGLPISVDGADAGWFVKAPVITLRLTAKPFGYGPEVTGSTATSSSPVVTVAQAGVTGDVPAEARLVVTDMASKDRRHVEWGVEWRYYNAATSLIVDSDDMITSGYSGTQSTNAGAYDPNASGNNVILCTLAAQPVAICATGNLSHVGAFRVKCRLVRESSSNVYVRLVWQEGDGPFRANPYAFVALNNQWNEVDLGIISIPPKTLGTQRWSGRLEGYADTPGETVKIDYCSLIPVAEGYGKARGIQTYAPGPLVARDEFDQAGSPNLTGQALPIGGTWTVVASSDAADYTVASGSQFAQRSVNADANANTGRYVSAGTTSYAGIAVQSGLIFSQQRGSSGSTMRAGVFARLVDINNWLFAGYNTLAGGVRPADYFLVAKRVAGTLTTLAYVPFLPSPYTEYKVYLAVYASGLWAAWLFEGATPTGMPTLAGYDPDLVTAGTLATGKVGLQDAYTGTGAPNRAYAHFAVSTPAVEPIVCYSGQSIEFRHDDPLREDSTGAYYGPPPSYRGSRFLLQPAGDENRTSRILAKARRNDVDVAADDQIADSTKLEVFWTPRYVAAPR